MMPATACREAYYNRDIINMRDDSSSWYNSKLHDVKSSPPPESVEKLPTVE
jgi:hypothetical protein